MMTNPCAVTLVRKARALMTAVISGTMAFLCGAGDVTVSAVSAKQRYPWNGLVDITVTLSGTSTDIAQTECLFAATNSATQTGLSVMHINRDGNDVGYGAVRRFIWDAAADVGEVKIDDVELTVSAGVGVQLWENGPRWAEYNVGATKPEGYGYYFWWGDTVGYKWNGSNWEAADGSTYAYSFATCPTYKKDNAMLRSLGYIDSTGNLSSAHDAATAHLGKPWRMPTDAEINALVGNCTATWTNRNDVNGWLMAGKGKFASKSIFFPAVGWGREYSLEDAGSNGIVWSATPESVNSYYGYVLHLSSTFLGQNSSLRYNGHTVRPLRANAEDGVGTAHLALDCRTGMRIAGATEQICFSPRWVTSVGGAVATVSLDGVVVTNAARDGTFAWTPTENGTYSFTHVVSVEGNPVGKTLNASFIVNSFSPDAPVIAPIGGMTFDTSLTVSMTCASAGATIHYTTDGSVPTQESPVYSKFKIYGRTTVKAIAFYDDGTPSEMAVAEYAKGVCAEPYVLPADGTTFDHSGQVVTLGHDNPEGVLRYTTDGSDPTEESAEYAGPLTIDETTTVKAKVFGETHFDSGVVTANLTRVWLKVATPEISAPAQFTGSKQKVTIACATGGALVRYTTNGIDPNSHSTKYTGPFYVTDTATVKAYATKSDYANSDVATLAIVKDWGIGDTMGKPDHAFATSGDAVFVRTNDASAALGESMRSGPIGDGQRSVLSSAVIGPGTLSFKWKTSCEQDDEYEWDHAEFRVNGVLKGRLNGVTDWVAVSQRIEGEGTNTVTWTYIKDDVEYVGEDCLWVSEYVWASDYTATQTTDVPVPYDWLREKSRDIVDEYGNYEKVAKQKAYNQRYTVEQCYVAGLDPESATNEFTASIEMVGSVPNITWSPDKKSERDYKVWGKEALDDGAAWVWPTNALHRFFKVTVEMP